MIVDIRQVVSSQHSVVSRKDCGLFLFCSFNLITRYSVLSPRYFLVELRCHPSEHRPYGLGILGVWSQLQIALKIL